jgi:putative FmdB family regulatory protein
MPTYEYICKKCGHEFEASHSMAAPPLKVCPKELCARKKWGRGPVTKKMSAGAGLLFKGSGFYITDYRSEGYKSAAKKESTGGETKTAAKPEAKPEAKPAATKKADKK